MSKTGANIMHETTGSPEKSPSVAKELDQITFYHFGLDSLDRDYIVSNVRNIKAVCCGGSSARMEKLAEFLYEQFKPLIPNLAEPHNLSRSDRFVMFKVGQVLCVSHGMGPPSLSIMLTETLLLLSFADNKNDVVFIRVGTSGGIGIPPFSIMVSNRTCDGLFRECYDQKVLGVVRSYDAKLDQEVAQALADTGKRLGYSVYTGMTLCAEGFYEEQARMNGYFCEYTKEQVREWIETAHSKGVRNIEMESTCFAALLHRANRKGAIICITLVNRLNGDVISQGSYLNALNNLKTVVFEYLKSLVLID